MLLKEESEKLLESIVELLDIPPSYYEKAADRYRSLGEWLHRKESKVAALDPEVYLQGSFRYGTVTRPLMKDEEYDLDLACQVKLGKGDVTQKELKHLIGFEVKAYADANGIIAPPVERNRCWCLDYADDVSFHMDILPCVPEDLDVIRTICAAGVPAHIAVKSVAITDRRRRDYDQITRDWPCSNPRGLGDWFEEQAKPVAIERIASLVDGKAYASIDQVPSYEWKTPLQRAIQLLKRHRDVMFKDDSEFAPISMILTVLAARAYKGETTILGAIRGIVDRMPLYVGRAKPRIPNPVNPREDFSDRWASDPSYEENFWSWHTAVKADLENLPAILQGGKVASEVRSRFMVNLTEKQLRSLNVSTGSTIGVPPKAAPYVHISSSAAPKPWRRDA
jgi:hypothetical protein